MTPPKKGADSLYFKRYGTRDLHILTSVNGRDRAVDNLVNVTRKHGGTWRFYFTRYDLAKDPAKVLTDTIWKRPDKKSLYRIVG